MKLIHYGSPKYKPELFKKVKNNLYRNKPEFGLWTSPIDSKYGWKEWCKEENFRDCNKDESFIIEINIDKMLVIDKEPDLKKIPFLKSKYSYISGIDFEKLVKQYDAIHLTIEGELSTRWLNENNLYGWDCECVLILNKSCII